ncbi:MAG: hypothetical protein Q8Q31_03770 [Nanoarchaeota archaeon]|nr:hypothetical protein [Nanoarchaeota archaeon]
MAKNKEEIPKEKKAWYKRWWAIVIFIIVILWVLSLLSSPSNKEIPLSEKELSEKWARESLADRGYEVLLLGAINISARAPFFEWHKIKDNTICPNLDDSCYSNKVSVMLVMKSLGNREEQVVDVLSTLSVMEKNAFVFNIEIKSPTDTCNYVVFGNTYRTFIDDPTTTNYQILLNEIKRYESCS